MHIVCLLFSFPFLRLPFYHCILTHLFFHSGVELTFSSVSGMQMAGGIWLWFQSMMIWTGAGRGIIRFFFLFARQLAYFNNVLWFQAEMRTFLFSLILPTMSRKAVVPSINPGPLGSRHQDGIKCTRILQGEMPIWKEIEKDPEEDRNTLGYSHASVWHFQSRWTWERIPWLPSLSLLYLRKAL